MSGNNLPATAGFQFIAGNLALDFVNTVGNRLTERRDYFLETEDVNRWARLAGLLARNEALPLSSREIESIRLTREYLYGLFQQVRLRGVPSDSSIARLNKMLAQFVPRRQLKCVNQRLSWQWAAGRQPSIRIVGPVLLSASDLLASASIEKLRQCEDEACGWLFLDRSQAGKRRWCSMADCGNREKARRYYDNRYR